MILVEYAFAIAVAIYLIGSVVGTPAAARQGTTELVK